MRLIKIMIALLVGVVCTFHMSKSLLYIHPKKTIITVCSISGSFLFLQGIFVTKLHANGAATNILHPGDKILSVNGQDFTHMEHNSAVASLKQQPTRVAMVIERMLKPTDV